MAGNDGYLYDVPSDANPNDGRLRDPTALGSYSSTNVGGIASAEAFGAAAATLVSALGAIGSAEVLGAVAPVLVSVVGGITGAEAFGAPQSTLGSLPAPSSPEPVYGMGAPPRRPRRPKPRPLDDDAPYIPPPLQFYGVGAIASDEAFGVPLTTLGPVPGRKRRREEELLLLHA